MVGLAGGILKGSKDIFPLEKRMVGKDLFVRSPRRQQVEDVRDPHPQSANARPSTALALFNRDSLQAFSAHWLKDYDIFHLIATPTPQDPVLL